MAPVVTVGICVRNGENLLPAAIGSLLNQDFPKEQMQVIFVDDGSKDKTSQIIQKYLPLFGDAAKFFRTSWRGLGYARKLISQEAAGKYLLFVDADQVLTAAYVKTQVAVLEKNPRVAVTSGVFKTVPGNLLLNLEVAPYIVNQRKYGQPKSLIWATDKLIGTGGTAFRIEALRQANGFNEKITGAGEDTDLVLRIKKMGWLIQPNMAELCELHGGLSKPKDLWKKYFWYGHGCHKIFCKTREAFLLPRMSPIAGFVTGVFYSFPAYRFLRQKQVFLLPLHFGFKLTAWTFGFMKAQLQSKN